MRHRVWEGCGVQGRLIGRCLSVPIQSSLDTVLSVEIEEEEEEEEELPLGYEICDGTGLRKWSSPSTTPRNSTAFLEGMLD